MRLLFAIAACCCVVLVGAAAALWRSIQQQRHINGVAEYPSFGDTMHKKLMEHPRMDLAAGVAAGNTAMQHVRGAARRRGLSLDAEAQASAAAAKAPVKVRSRRDWAYYNENLGDLSDPDLRRAPAGGVRRPLGSLGIPESR